MTFRKSKFWSLLLAYAFFFSVLGVYPLPPPADATIYSVALNPKFKAFEPGTGNPLASGKLYTYLPGTTTLTTTYKDYAAAATNTNPIILDANGECDLFYAGYLKLALYDASNVLVWTKDNIPYGGIFSSITGDNTGRISGFSIGSASYTDNGYFGDLIVKSSPYVDVRAYGAALTHVPIQTALSAIDNSVGADVYIPRGQYEIGTGLLLQGKSNVKIRGDGIDVTILHMNLGTATKPAVFNADGNWGILSIESDAAYASPATNITIEDMTFWLDNTGTPGSFGADSVTNGPYWIKNVFYRYVENITFNRVKIRGSRWEALYSDGTAGTSATDIKIFDSEFKDTQHDAVDVVNTTAGSDIVIDRCVFDNTAYGIQTMLNRAILTNLKFKNPKHGAIAGWESSYPRAEGTPGGLISNVLITGLGTGNTLGNADGIRISGGDSPYTDNTMDSGLMISNIAVINSVKEAGSIGYINSFNFSGASIKASNLYVSGLTKGAGASGDTTAFVLSRGAVSGASRQQIFMDNFTLDNTLGGSVLWDIGISATGNDNSQYIFGSGEITAVAATNYALYAPTTYGSPLISLGGVILNGYIYYSGVWADPGTGVINYSGEFNNQRVYGSSTKGLRTDSSDDILFYSFTDNATTPSVAAGKHFKTENTGATTITNFTGGNKGEAKSVTFTDNVTIVQNNSTVKLQGAADFTATPNDTLTILYDGGTWRELHRSVN